MTSFPGHREQSTWPGNKAIRGAYLAWRMAVKGEAFVSGFRNQKPLVSGTRSHMSYEL